MDVEYATIARMVDHSLLGPALADGELEDGCRLAAEYAVASVCIKPYFVGRAAEVLRGSGVKVGTTVGFPHGGQSRTVKTAEAEEAIGAGARELDMVINIGWARSGAWDDVSAEIGAIVELAHRHGAIVKVILENCFLDDVQKQTACAICAAVGADYAKTSTGYGPGGATLADLRLMRAHLPDTVGLKAAGGIRTLDQLLEVRACGCTRVGLSRTREILDELRRRIDPEPDAVP